jgi:hypothetical protein
VAQHAARVRLRVPATDRLSEFGGWQQAEPAGRVGTAGSPSGTAARLRSAGEEAA